MNKGTGKSARRTRRNNPGEAGDSVRDYRYDESKRLHNPPAGLTGQKPTMAAEGPPQVSYDPHKPPVLRFDPSGAVDRKHKGHESLPFEPGEHWAVAVKVIDLRGNEVMRVLRFPESESGAST